MCTYLSGRGNYSLKAVDRHLSFSGFQSLKEVCVSVVVILFSSDDSQFGVEESAMEKLEMQCRAALNEQFHLWNGVDSKFALRIAVNVELII